MTYHVPCYGNRYVLGKSGSKSLERVTGTGKVDAATAVRIMALVKKIAPFTSSLPSDAEQDGLDGSMDLVEFAGDGKYNVFKRWSLDVERHGDLGKLGAVLLKVKRQVCPLKK